MPQLFFILASKNHFRKKQSFAGRPCARIALPDFPKAYDFRARRLLGEVRFSSFSGGKEPFYKAAALQGWRLFSFHVTTRQKEDQQQ
jgi:hypothetical protein